jgi:ubiquinone/menaquinone biosynthesis C-methylase UbiE
MSLESSRKFWDEKAKENAPWYVSSYGPFTGRNLDEFWRSGQQIWETLKRATGYAPRAADSVVEIGCGVGRLSQAISREVGHLDAFDISEEMLRIAREGDLENTTFHVTEGASLRPVADSSADLVLAYCVFQHLPSVGGLRSYLEEMARVAKPDGLKVFTLSPRDWRVHLRPLLKIRARLRERLSPSGPKGLWRQEWYGIRPSKAEVREMTPWALQMTNLHADKWLFWGT